MKKILALGLLLSFLTITFCASVQVDDTRLTDRPATTQPPCKNGFYWTGQSCMPCAQVTDGTNKVTGYCVCSDYLKCTEVKCNDGFENTGSTSNPTCTSKTECATECSTCGLNQNQDAFVCYSCQKGYTLVGSICIFYQACASVDPKTALCTSCLDGYYFNYDFTFNYSPTEKWSTYYKAFDDFCSKCMNYCAKCASSNTCIQCNTGYEWTLPTTANQVGSCTLIAITVTKTCQTQFPNCKDCVTDLSTCNSCSDTFYLTTDKKSCLTCNISNSNLQGCKICQIPTVCLECYQLSNQNYFLTDKNVCSNCNINNCQQCTNKLSVATCQTCNDQYYLDSKNTQSTTSACLPCNNQQTVDGYIDGALACLKCSAANLCSSCSNQYVLNSGKCYKKLANCIGDYTFVTVSNGIQLSCQKCADQFYKVEQQPAGSKVYTCQQCSTSSETILQNSIRCGSPLDQDTPTPLNPLQPFQCKDNYFLVNTKCVQYDANNTCLKLKSNSSSQVCAICLPGYIGTGADSGTCLLCSSVPNCKTCSVSATDNTKLVCNSCISQYYVSGTTCTACSSNCSVCSDSATCTTCLDNYYLVNKACTKCSDDLCKTCTSDTGCQTCLLSNQFVGLVSPTSKVNTCYQCPPECATCDSPGKICKTCVSGYILTNNGGCVLATQDNCLKLSTTADSGCQICDYGFAKGAKGACLQCLNPYSATVCRENVQDPSTNTTTNGTTPNSTSDGNQSQNSNILSLIFAVFVVAFTL